MKRGLEQLRHAQPVDERRPEFRFQRANRDELVVLGAKDAIARRTAAEQFAIALRITFKRQSAAAYSVVISGSNCSDILTSMCRPRPVAWRYE